MPYSEGAAGLEPPTFGFVQSNYWPRPKISRALMDELGALNARFMEKHLRPEITRALSWPSPVRPKTILLVEGINELTGRPIRIYIRPDDTLVACETIGQLERTT